MFSGRVHESQQEWIDSLLPKFGNSKSDLLRHVLAVAQRHEEELTEAS